MVVVVINFSLFVFFSKTSGPISTKLRKKHSWVNGIYVCRNEGSSQCPRRDNNEMAKNTSTKFLKNLLLKNYKTNFNQTWPKAKAGLGVESLRPSVRPSQNLVIATPLKLLNKLS